VEIRHRKLLPWFAGLFLALLTAYSNHFGNSFHFDDAHVVVNNPAIRSLAGIPRFFTDVKTHSSNPEGQAYRPLVTTSLAVDYALGGGLEPFWFHLSTFFWFLVQLILMYALYLHVLEQTCPNPRNPWLAWFAVALYALHPASAETVNYIVQRADLYVALGIVAGVVVYAWKPEARRYGLYLLPPLAAMFAKPTAIVFAPILLAYIVLIDRGLERAESLFSCALRSIPAFVLCAAFAYLEKVMTPPTFFHTTLKSFDYWITQPYVTLRYFRTFFLPLYLSVDTDLQAFHSLSSGLALAGCVFCALLTAAAIYTASVREWRPVSFDFGGS
jgi:protein O-mannosyl-transferase